jgi:transglutaminase/protease-like cytokinesis protein 3
LRLQLPDGEQPRQQLLAKQTITGNIATIDKSDANFIDKLKKLINDNKETEVNPALIPCSTTGI